MNIRSTEAADADLLDIARRFETERPGLGEAFFAAYRGAAENIERFPRMYPETDDGFPGIETRNAILERFGFRVIYWVRATEVVILAVWRGSRRPGSWNHRLLDHN